MSLYSLNSGGTESDVEKPPAVVTGTFRLGLPSARGRHQRGNARSGGRPEIRSRSGPSDPFQLSLVTGVGFYYWTFRTPTRDCSPDTGSGIIWSLRRYRHHVILAGLQMARHRGVELTFRKGSRSR